MSFDLREQTASRSRQCDKARLIPFLFEDEGFTTECYLRVRSVRLAVYLSKQVGDCLPHGFDFIGREL